MREAMSARDAIVIGGGVVGMNCALSLQVRGLRVTLIDPCATRPPSVGNAGHIAVEQVEPLASPATLRALPGQLYWRGGPVSLPLREFGAWLPFSLRFLAASHPRRFAVGKAALSALAAAAIPAWRRQLDRVGATDLLIEDGHYLVWESPAAAEAGRRRWAKTETGTVSVRECTGDELARISAQLSRPLAGGLRFSGSGQIADLEQLATALAGGFERQGGVRLPLVARKLVERSGKIEAVLDNGVRLSADILVVAAGIASAELLAPLGYRVPLIAERGYHLQAAETDWPADFPPVVFEERAMLVTRFRSGLRAAGLFEFGRAGSPPDPRKWARLRGHLDSLGIAFADPVEWMGARPTLPDYLPAIGRSRRLPGLYYAFGHQHLGLTLAAATGEALAALVVGEAPPVDLKPYAIERF